MTSQTPSLKIGLLDNSYHSLRRGYEMWSQWRKSEDAWLLKESVIWVHHGIELALKQLLVQTNEFLVFDDVNRAVERLGILRRKRGMENAGVLDLFDHDGKAMSVGFKNLIERAAITLPIPELAENEPLRSKIDELTKYRNKVVHFSIEVEIQVVSNLLSDILDPLLAILFREVKDDNFKNKRIPEIRRIAQPVQEFSRQYQREIVDRAVTATLHALPPTGNRKAGIVWQAVGSGLGSSVASYIEQVRNLPEIRNSHVIVATDRVDLAAQIYNHLVDRTSHNGISRIFFPEDRNTLSESLSSREPTVVVSTIQKFDQNIIATNQRCLFVGYNLHALYDSLVGIFPNATYILFTNTPPQQGSPALQTFGEVISKYDLKQAIQDGVITKIIVEQRTVEVTADDFSVEGNSDQQSVELTSFINARLALEMIARDIVQHFESRQEEVGGKGVIIIPNLETGAMLYREIANIRPDWAGNTATTGSIKTVSAVDYPAQRSIVLERFRNQADPLGLLICTGSWLMGFDNPLIHTAYIASPISLQLRHILAGLVSRQYPGKEYGMIVDYRGHDWNID